MEELIKLANEGDMSAQEKVAVAYMRGSNGIQQNMKEAIKYFELASNNGSGMANYQMGKAYEKGNGVLQNSTKALEYYQKSADLGYVNAINLLKQMDQNNSQSKPTKETTNTNIGTKYQAPEVKNIETGAKNNVKSSYSSKSKTIAILLAIFFSTVGGHNWYLGYKTKAIIQILLSIVGLFVISEIWGIIDAVQISKGKINDANGGVLI